MRWAHAAATLAFAAFAALQYNDPDPVRWMAIYLAAAAACVLASSRRLHWMTAAGLAALAALWAIAIAVDVRGPVAWRQVFGPEGMLAPGVEEVRECLGLAIVAGWMILAAALSASSSSPRAARESPSRARSR